MTWFFTNLRFAEIDNDPNWHGKPLGAKSDAVIAHVQSLIRNKSLRLGCELLPIRAPSAPLPANDISNIKLSKAPAYKLGDQVRFELTFCC